MNTPSPCCIVLSAIKKGPVYKCYRIFILFLNEISKNLSIFVKTLFEISFLTVRIWRLFQI